MLRVRDGETDLEGLCKRGDYSNPGRQNLIDELLAVSVPNVEFLVCISLPNGKWTDYRVTGDCIVDAAIRMGDQEAHDFLSEMVFTLTAEHKAMISKRVDELRLEISRAKEASIRAQNTRKDKYGPGKGYKAPAKQGERNKR